MAKNTSNALKVLSKLFEAGYTTEKQITAMTTMQMLTVPNLSKEEMLHICALQQAIRDGKVITYLGNAEKPPEKQAEPQAE